jgi:serine/threonine protein kinase
MRVWEQPVPGYYVEQLLGRGTHVELWRATAPGGEPCALKVLTLTKTFTYKAFRTLALAKRVRHPNLVPVLGAWSLEADGRVLGEDAPPAAFRAGGDRKLILATGLWDKSLADRLKESPNGLAVPELLRWLDDAARGIDYLNKPAHDLGDGKTAIVHGYVKPTSLVLIGDAVQVTDFGFPVAPSMMVKLEESGGTPWYAPVELLNNAPGPQTDQFALAVTYYELRTGRLPFDKNRAMVAILLGQLDLTGLPEPERMVVKRATSAQPANRFPTCREFVEALRAVTEGKGPPGPDRPTPLPPAGVPGSSPVRWAEAQRVPPSSTIAFTPAQLNWPASRYPDRVGDYELVQLLGEGGMGAVYEARDVRLNRSVALKLILPQHAANPDARARFLREARSLALVRHDHVVPVYAAGEQDGMLFLVMPLLRGETLEKRLKRGRLPLATAVRVGREVADGLAAAHEAGLMHRDVKPSNVWLEADDADGFRRCVLLDFGLARRVSTTPSHAITVEVALLGTAAYMSPEQAGGGAVDARTDVYSLGVTLYELTTGAQPFAAPELIQSLFKVANVVPPPAAAANPEVPAGLSELIARMMAKTPDGRPASARAVADELARLGHVR